MSKISGVALPAVEPTKVWNPVFIQVLIANIFMQMGQFMMNTLIPKYTSSLGAGPSVIGIVSSMFAVTALLMRVFSGPVTMSFSKKKIAAIATIGIAVSFCLYGLSTTIPMVIVARLLHGCGMSFTGPTALAIASDALPHKKLAAGIGIFSIGQAAATAVGPSIGLWLISAIGYSNTFFTCAALIIVSAILIYTVKSNESVAKKPFKISFNTIIAKEAFIPMLLIMFLIMSYHSVSAFLVLFAESMNIGNIGLFFTVYAAVLLVSRPLIALLSDRFGVRRLILPAMICFALSMILIGISTTLPMFLVAAAVCAVGFGSCQPTIQTLCIKSVSPERRGVGGSTNFVGMDIGSLIGSVTAGVIADHLGYKAMYFSLTVPIAIAITIFIVFFARITEIDTGDHARVIEQPVLINANARTEDQ